MEAGNDMILGEEGAAGASARYQRSWGPSKGNMPGRGKWPGGGGRGQYGGWPNGPTQGQARGGTLG